MIPSRPLDFGGILTESVRIIKETWWRSALISLICVLPGIMLFLNGTDELLGQADKLATKYIGHSEENIQVFRDYVILNSTAPSEISIYRIQYPLIMNTIDSVRSAVDSLYPDSASRQALSDKADSLGRLMSAQSSEVSIHEVWEYIWPSLWWILVGSLLLGIGGTASGVANFDLASRAFEQRALPIGRVFGNTFRRWVWLQLVQYLLIILAMGTGLGVVVGLTAALSVGFAVLGVFVSFGLIFYALIRMAFSSVSLVSENLGPVAAIKRSFELTSRSWWRVLGYLIVALIMVMTVSAILRVPFSFAYSFDELWVVHLIKAVPGSLHELINGLRSLVETYWWAMLIPSALIASLFPSFLTSFYYDLRTRRDGPLDYYDKATVLTSQQSGTATETNNPE